jgi:predicted transcriptional regulator
MKSTTARRPADATFTVRIPSEVRDLLESISISTNRSKNYLAREAITRYVETEAEIIEGIKEGLRDSKAGRVVSHVEVMKLIRQTIAAASRKK